MTSCEINSSTWLLASLVPTLGEIVYSLHKMYNYLVKICCGYAWSPENDDPVLKFVCTCFIMDCKTTDHRKITHMFYFTLFMLPRGTLSSLVLIQNSELSMPGNITIVWLVLNGCLAPNLLYITTIQKG